MAAGTFKDQEIDRVDDAHDVLQSLQQAGFCVVRLEQLAELEDKVSQVHKV
jgi:hypothetical protein